VCGIVGIFSPESKEISYSLIEQMNNALHHRGPDGQGLHLEPHVGLGHKRLSIIDIAGGVQPLYNEDKSVVVVYNGEIYNYRALIKDLKKRGHKFRTECDTEVIVHAWEEWGEKCVSRFRGMFAFALWDRHRRNLFLARDRIGIKPLYYSRLADGQIVFGSELKALLLHPELSKKIDGRAIEDYFAFGYIPDPKTIFQDVYKLPPGHTISFFTNKSTKTIPHRYWDVPFKSQPNMTEPDAAVELIERAKEAIDFHTVSDVPLGAFLSGGVDSSAVVALLAKMKSEPINTCSISFNETQYDEAPYAKQVAETYGTRHFSDVVDSSDRNTIERLSRLYDEPYADSSALPTYKLCQLARRRVKVALSGDGGDENFAGYRSYRLHMNKEKVRAMLPQGFRSTFFGVLGRYYPKIDWAPQYLRAKRTFEDLAVGSIQSFAQGAMITTQQERANLFSSNLKAELQGYEAVEVLLAHAKRAPTEHPLSLVQYLDLKVYLPSDILTKVDIASMANSLEVRVPLLDHQLVEWVSGLPPAFKLRSGEGKHIFKQALRPYLSDDILYRKKMGFSIPLANWLRNGLRENVRGLLSSPGIKGSGFFNLSYLHKVIREHELSIRDHSSMLWALLQFDAFYRNQVGGTRGIQPVVDTIQQPSAISM